MSLKYVPSSEPLHNPELHKTLNAAYKGNPSQKFLMSEVSL